MSFWQQTEEIRKTFEDYFLLCARAKFSGESFGTKLLESVNYSLFSGGKRFRPVLHLVCLQAMGVSLSRGMAFASALEFIHTSSLIHDDLPCMDDDDERRGKPSNHKLYGEAVALLAGNSLLIEAYKLLSENYEKPSKLIDILAMASGAQGMMLGQAMDIEKPKQLENVNGLTTMQGLKTGRLINAAVLAAAEIANINDKQFESAKNFGESLGLAFQIKDDLLDFPEDAGEVSFPHLLGRDKAVALLKDTSQNALEQVSQFTNIGNSLSELVNYNLNRNG